MASSLTTRVEDTTLVYNSDTEYGDKEEYSSVISAGRIVQLPLVLPFSLSGTKSVLNKLQVTAPNWMWVDQSSGLVTIDTSQAAIGVPYSFGVETTIPPSSWPHIRKSFSISVGQWVAQSITDKCVDCVGHAVDQWGECQYGYVVSDDDGTWVESDTNTTLIILSQVFAGTGVLLVIMSWSSLFVIWIIVNQIQLISLLVLTGGYIPPAVKQILIGSLYTSFSFAKIPVIDIPGINIPLKELHIEQENENIELMGVESGSSFTFNSIYLMVILILVIVHFLSLLISKNEDEDKHDEDRKQQCCRKFHNSVAGFMGFTVYVRLFIEILQYMLLSSISEVHARRTSTTQNMISLGFAWFVLTICLLGTIFVIVMIWVKNPRMFHRFREAFSGLKETRAAKSYILITMFLRKIFYIGIMITLVPRLTWRQILQGIGKPSPLFINSFYWIIHLSILCCSPSVQVLSWQSNRSDKSNCVHDPGVVLVFPDKTITMERRLGNGVHVLGHCKQPHCGIDCVE